MPKNDTVSISVIKRLPRYYRFLGELLKNGVNRISSRELAQIMRLTASQIRQDLNCFGGFGQQGYGYNVSALHGEIGNILGLQLGTKTILIGAGNLGRTIATHMDFENKGFDLIGIFDKNSEIIGRRVRGLPIRDIQDLSAFCHQNQPRMAVLCIPKESAQEIADLLVSLGIKGFWNFSHYDLTVNYENIVVENVHLGDSLMPPTYHVKEMAEKEAAAAAKQDL